jgi:phosphatidylinositol glycan class C protein
MTPPPNIHGITNGKPSLERRPFSDPSRLAPEDAFFAHSPPRRQRDGLVNGSGDGSMINEAHIATRLGINPRRRREKDRGRSGSRRRKNVWKKLLWVKQPCMTTIMPSGN